MVKRNILQSGAGQLRDKIDVDLPVGANHPVRKAIPCHRPQLPNYRGAGIRLHYDSKAEAMEDLREGVLLEVGFDKVAPNEPKDISSWLYDHAASADIIDNQAKGVLCYDPGYTFVEKLQTVSTKFRNRQVDGGDPVEFM